MTENRIGPPVRGKEFYGRDKFVKLVSDQLRNGHVLLAAPRRFGKTSVMFRLIDDPKWDYRIVHADLEHLTDPAVFISELIVKLAKDGKLAKALSTLKSLPSGIWESFKSNFEEIELYDFKVKIREQISARWQDSGEELFQKIAESKTTIVFFLDEFPMMIDRMARTGKREEAISLLRWLRSIRNQPHNHNLRFLIAGSIGIDRVLNELGEIASINDFEQIRLEPFSAKVATAFLQELSQSHSIPLTTPSIRKILALLGTPVPYFLQIMFSEIYKTYVQDDEPITPKKIEQIYRNKILGVNCKTYFDHYYGRLREYYPPHEEKAIKRILRELAVVDAMTRDACFQFYQSQVGQSSDVDSFNRLMSDLEQDFYIAFDAEARQYKFACKMLRDWWLRHYGMES